MSAFVVKLSTQAPPAFLATSTPMQLNGDSGEIFVTPNELDLHTIALCARKLTSMVSSNISLEGDWHLEQQWAFAQSFFGPKTTAKLHWCENTDKVKLQQMLESLLFTRSIVNQTPEQLSPESLSEQASTWLRSLSPSNVSIKAYVGEQLVEAGWNGIYEVGRGSVRPPVLLEVDYNPTQNADASVEIALVGKGITFDSGGYSIKSSEGMLDMKCDMGGAATVTGALGLAIQQGLSKRVKLFLCCAENLISGHAYKLGDIITYKNGTTVEIVNTDAEGRLVLADGLMAATESGAPIIVDAATLTGAAVMAVGREYNAVFSMDKDLCASFLAISEQVNEPHWPLPLTPAHKYKCPSPFADTANSRPQKGGGAGGASNAAGFLSRFVNEEGKGWLHIDLAAAYNRDGNEVMPAGGTAMGMRSISELLLG
ncbi:aminopeptidase PepB [Glaciecola sp. XM2]|uniref:aminopeptidase PepB n=1 Tax=Glaciecola sp. XM2 TaxID=1914931 RepID=UPI001BDE70A9|nr:aminopeptidase PepB [Glaciecola sp. XM2]MBT1452166.1 aminopeptidase PepB [Glaciecola sp. XM2]